MKLRRVEDQVIVITGASSGIGLTTARMAAERGARVVLVARSGSKLQDIVDEIRDAGGEACSIVADVADREAVARIVELAVSHYGGIDTWVNNAGVAIYGRTEDIPIEDQRRLFDVTYWGVVHGCLAALPQLRASGGALINIGSVESDVGVPLNGIYAAAKHAVKGFTDALRAELLYENAPVAVTLIKPSAIDTPFFEHAKSTMRGNLRPPQPMYAPEVVARAILECAEHPTREITVGGSGRAMVGMARALPRVADRLSASFAYHAQEPGRPETSALYEPCAPFGKERGEHPGTVRRRSAYTYARLHPVTATAAALGIAGAVAGAASALARR